MLIMVDAMGGDNAPDAIVNGSAMIFGTAVAILTSVFPAEKRGKILGINVAAVYIGLSSGPFLGGVLTQHFGWRSIFFSNVPIGVLIIVFVVWKLKDEWAQGHGKSFDYKGSIIYGISLFSTIYGLSLLPAFSGFVFIVLGIIGIILFGIYESKIQSPILFMGLFKDNRIMVFSSLAALISYSATFGVAYVLSMYLQYIKELSPQAAGVVLIAQPIMQAVFSPFAGRLSDKIEPQKVASVGMSLTAAGLFYLIFLNNSTNLVFIVASLALLGLGFAFFSSPNTNAIMSSVSKGYYGVASGMIGTMRLIGQMFSMGIVMLAFALFIGRVQITPEYYTDFLSSLRVIFIILTILCVIGIFASLARGKIRSNP